MYAPESFEEECFALLDDCDASEAAPSSRLYTGYVGALWCIQDEDLPALWDELAQALNRGRFAVGLCSYELGADAHAIAPYPVRQPRAQVLLFTHCARLSSNQVDAWLDLPERPSFNGHAAGVVNISASISKTEFFDAITRIHAYIEAGDTYQVNYTYRLRFTAYGGPKLLYKKLRERQRTPYGALILLPDRGAVLSLSPELFFRHEGGRLTARPMKGTAGATGDAAVDAACAEALATDAKNRAENIMIVDLVRNDMGKVAVPGSVRVSKLFNVERYGSVLQMTTMVTAMLRGGVTLADIFAAIYPCGSITGAPKHRTMQIIRELEHDPRGLYTGAIGWFDAAQGAHPVGDFCLSVPIRTLVLTAPDGMGLRRGEMGVGAGIVYDSLAAEEFEECRLKTRFLTELPAGFELVETIYATRVAGCRHVLRHLKRLRTSAGYFGFGYHEGAVLSTLQQVCEKLPEGEHRVRLALNQMGTCSAQHVPLSPLVGPLKVLLAEQPIDARDIFLRHKTTVRQRYDAALREAEERGAFDMLFHNELGELTEGGRSNVFIRLGGQWFTPPVASGLLPGVMRAVLLADPGWSARERVLTLDDLRASEAVVMSNALRGALPVSVA